MNGSVFNWSPAEGDFPLGGSDAAPTSLQTLRAACPLHRLPSGERVPCPLPGGGSQIPLSLTSCKQLRSFTELPLPEESLRETSPVGPRAAPRAAPKAQRLLGHVHWGLPGGWSLTLPSTPFPEVTLSQTLTGAASPGGRPVRTFPQSLFCSVPPLHNLFISNIYRHVCF